MPCSRRRLGYRRFPPNRTCDFHRIRLSSLAFIEGLRRPRFRYLVRKVGLEPTHLSALVPKTSVSAISPLPPNTSTRSHTHVSNHHTTAGLKCKSFRDLPSYFPACIRTWHSWQTGTCFLLTAAMMRLNPLTITLLPFLRCLT